MSLPDRPDHRPSGVLRFAQPVGFHGEAVSGSGVLVVPTDVGRRPRALRSRMRQKIWSIARSSAPNRCVRVARRPHRCRRRRRPRAFLRYLTVSDAPRPCSPQSPAPAPIPASSGLTNRHSLNRGGDRQLNRALHTIVLTRSRTDPKNRAHITRRLAEGKTVRETKRCHKRIIARQNFRLLQQHDDPIIRVAWNDVAGVHETGMGRPESG
jgi:Transposase IS116/IS110/IS902 family